MNEPHHNQVSSGNWQNLIAQWSVLASTLFMMLVTNGVHESVFVLFWVS